MTIIHLIGNLGKDCEKRVTNNGNAVRVLSLAVNQRVKDKDFTTWYSVNAWGNSYDKVSQYWTKGTALSIVGILKPPEVYSDNSGNTRVQLEVRAMNISFVPSSTNKTKQSESLNNGPQAGMGKVEPLSPEQEEDDDICPF